MVNLFNWLAPPDTVVWDYTYMKLNAVGTRVRAIRLIDFRVADVQVGDTGTVTAEVNAFGDGAGFIVEWDKGGMCNVYPGQVEGE